MGFKEGSKFSSKPIQRQKLCNSSCDHSIAWCFMFIRDNAVSDPVTQIVSCKQPCNKRSACDKLPKIFCGYVAANSSGKHDVLVEEEPCCFWARHFWLLILFYLINFDVIVEGVIQEPHCFERLDNLLVCNSWSLEFSLLQRRMRYCPPCSDIGQECREEITRNLPVILGYKRVACVLACGKLLVELCRRKH